MIGLNNLHVSPRLLRTICAIDRFQGYWNALDDHTTGLNLLSDVATHGEKLKGMLEPLRDKDLDMYVLRALHATFNSGDNGGAFKETAEGLPFIHGDNVIGTLETADADDCETLTAKLIDWVNTALQDEAYHPLLIIAVFTAVFLQISPFKGGNLKLARFLIILLLLKANYRYAPFSSLDEPFNANMPDLFAAITHTQSSVESGKPDWQQWLTCFFTILTQHYSVLDKQINHSIDPERLANMPDLSIKLLEYLQDNKRATMKDLIFATQGRRSTIKLRLQDLIEENLLIRHGAGRGVWYSLV